MDETRAPLFELQRVVRELSDVRQRWRTAQKRSREPGGRELPSRDALNDILEGLRGALFPMRLGPPDLHQPGEDHYVGHTLDTALSRLHEQATLELSHANADVPRDGVRARAAVAVRAFAHELPAIRRLLDTDVLAAWRGDPAAHSVDEVLLCYPGVLALTHHRFAHRLWQLGLPLLARIVAELAHVETGIDIHPGARIGASFFIDHGTGVVIGETAVIGERVRIYQAVTLGARHFPVDADGAPRKGLPRHPVIEDDVVIYAGATILGRITIGRGATIGGNVWVTRDVPPGAQVTQANLQSESRNRPAAA